MVETSPAPHPAADWFSPGRFAALLALFIVAAWPQVILGLQTFVYRDFGYFTYPVAQFQRDCFWRGELPLWNPLNCSGIPFLAQWNTATLYPPALFYLLLPLSWSLGVFQLFHLLLGGVGMFLLARRWTGSAFAAAFAGMAFAGNGLSQNSLMWVSNLAALMWMPWVLWLGERAWREGRKTLVLAALVAATQMLAGAPEIIALTWLLLALLLATAWRSPARWLFGRRFAALALLVAGLCAVQLLPFLDLLAHSHRDEHFPGSSWAMPVSGWANFLLPLFRAHESFHGVFLQNGQGWTASYYVGVATVALALLAAARRRTWPLAALALLGGWLALGDAGGLYHWLREHVPGMAFMRYPIKFIVLPVFLLPLLAAFALAETSPAEKTSRQLGAWLGVVAVLAGIVWFAARNPATGEVWPALWRNALARVALFTSIFAGVAMVKKISSREWRTRWQLAVLALLWLDLLTHAPRAKTINADAYSPAQQRDQLVLPAAGEGRAMLAAAAGEALEHSHIANPASDYISRHWALVSNCNLLDGVAQVDGFFSLRLREEITISALLFGDPNRFPARLADFLGVTAMTSPTNAFDWLPRTTALPLVTGGQKPIFADTDTTVRALMSAEFNPRGEVYLPPAARRGISFSKATPVKILRTEFSAHRVITNVDAAGPAMVVVAQAFYHPWHAFVDGRRVALLRANHAFQAVVVPAERHEVELLYEDESFSTGAGITFLTLAICVACTGWWRRKATWPSSS